MNPLLATDVAKKRLVEEVMAIKGRALAQPERVELRRKLKATSLEDLTALRDALLEETIHP